MKTLSRLVLCAVVCLGCSYVKTAPDTPPAEQCMECGGDGRVHYDAEHPIAELTGETGDFTCPMCGGSGQLFREPAQ